MIAPPTAGIAQACGSDLLGQYSTCCGNQDQFSIKGANVSGVLPSSFTLAKRFTDLSDNSGLCGTLTWSPRTDSSSNNSNSSAEASLPPFNLSGESNVQLDLDAMATKSTSIGSIVVRWLGSGAILYNNLARYLPAHQAYQACLLLDQGHLRVLQKNYCSNKVPPTCNCTARAQTSSIFKGQAAWDACHQDVWQLQFNTPEEQQLALQQYNQHMLRVDPAFACGGAGTRDRQAIMAWTFGISFAVIFIASLLFFFIYVKYLEGKPRGCLGTTVEVLCYMGLHAYDMVTDWLYVFSVAQVGNLPALLHVGWLFFAGYLLPQLTLFYIFYFVMFGEGTGSSPRRMLCVLYAVVALGYTVTGLVLLGLGTTNMKGFQESYTISTGDCVFLAKLFLGFGILSQVLLFFVGSSFKVLTVSSAAVHEDSQTFITTIMPDLVFLPVENIPQLVVQTVLWVKGVALVRYSGVCHVRSWFYCRDCMVMCTFDAA
jgi:hypothetical protein